MHWEVIIDIRSGLGSSLTGGVYLHSLVVNGSRCVIFWWVCLSIRQVVPFLQKAMDLGVSCLSPVSVPELVRASRTTISGGRGP